MASNSLDQSGAEPGVRLHVFRKSAGLKQSDAALMIIMPAKHRTEHGQQGLRLRTTPKGPAATARHGRCRRRRRQGRENQRSEQCVLTRIGKHHARERESRGPDQRENAEPVAVEGLVDQDRHA